MRAFGLRLAFSVIVAAVLALSASGAGPWSLFGTAMAVRTGAAPNPWAVRLSSTGPDAAFGGVAFKDPEGAVPFASLYHLSTDYSIVQGDCAGGSPRFSLAIDQDGDGTFDGNVFVYIGPFPNFAGCTLADWQTTGNFIPAPGDVQEMRWDSTQLGGPFYGTYNDAVAAVGASGRVLAISLVVDGSWMLNQVIDVDKIIVNDRALSARGYTK